MLKLIVSCLLAFPLFALPRVPISQTAAYNNYFAIDLYRQLITGSGNLVFQPYAISSAFAMAYLGAKEETEKEIADVFNFHLTANYLGETFKILNQNLSTDSNLSLASSLWYQKGLAIDDFKELAGKYYEGLVQEADFEIQTDSTRFDINKWVSEKTKKGIPQLLTVSDVTRSTKMLLIAQLYLRSPFAIGFNTAQTKTEKFFLNKISSRSVSMMRSLGEYPYYEDDDLKMIEIPYSQNNSTLARFSFFVIAPKDVEGLKDIEGQLNFDRLNNWLSGLRTGAVEVKIPRFRLNQILSLKEPLEKMGLKTAFTPESNFSGFSEKKAFVSRIVQKAAFSIDEKGTNAARAEPPSNEAPNSPEGQKQFTADRPFLFFVMDNNLKSIIFMGRMIQP